MLVGAIPVIAHHDASARILTLHTTFAIPPMAQLPPIT